MQNEVKLLKSVNAELISDMKILTQESKMISSEFEKSVKANDRL